MTDITTLSRRMFLLSPLALAACRDSGQILEFVGQTMGTTYRVVAIDSTGSVARDEAQVVIETALSTVNGAMSNWDAGSEISRLNADQTTDPVKMSRPLAEVMTAAAEVNAASLGRFDTTIGPLIEAWGFGAPGPVARPDAATITAALARSGQTNTLRIDGTQMQKQQPDAQVYLAAIGKGYGADLIARGLKDLGVTDMLVEIGGDLYAGGMNNQGTPWQIGIEAPNATDRQVLDVVGVSGMGLASSGDYRNYFEEDGVRYSHLIDPTTGRPVTHTTASATVLAENAMLADAWATALLILGAEAGLEVAQAQGLAVQFVERDTSAAALQFKTTTSSAFDAAVA